MRTARRGTPPPPRPAPCRTRDRWISSAWRPRAGATRCTHWRTTSRDWAAGCAARYRTPGSPRRRPSPNRAIRRPWAVRDAWTSGLGVVLAVEYQRRVQRLVDAQRGAHIVLAHAREDLAAHLHHACFHLHRHGLAR